MVDMLCRGLNRLRLLVAAAALILYVAAFVMSVAILLNSLWRPTEYFQVDFAVYYVASATLNAGQPLYDNALAADMYRLRQVPTLFSDYIYPPFLAVVLRPLALLPFGIAMKVWLVFNIGLLFLCIRDLFVLLGKPLKLASYLMATALAFAFPPVTYTIAVFGQVNLLILWLVLIFCNNLVVPHRGRATSLAGLAIGIATGIKLFAGLLIVYAWLIGRHRVASIGLLATALTLLIGAIGSQSVDTARYFADLLLHHVGVDHAGWFNYSIRSATVTLFRDTQIEQVFPFLAQPVRASTVAMPLDRDLAIRLGSLASSGLLCISIAVLALDVWRTQGSLDVSGASWRIAMILTTTLLIMPRSWISTGVMLLLPIALLLDSVSPVDWQGMLESIALSIALVLILLHAWWSLLGTITAVVPAWVPIIGTAGVGLIWFLVTLRIVGLYHLAQPGRTGVGNHAVVHTRR